MRIGGRLTFDAGASSVGALKDSCPDVTAVTRARVVFVLVVLIPTVDE